jgi:hypothetical protein
VPDASAIHRGADYYRNLRRRRVTAVGLSAAALSIAGLASVGLAYLVIAGATVLATIVLLRLGFALESWRNARRSEPDDLGVAVGGVTAHELRRVDPDQQVSLADNAQIPMRLIASRNGLLVEPTGSRARRGPRLLEWPWSTVEHIHNERLPWAAYPVSTITVWLKDGSDVAFAVRRPARFVQALSVLGVAVSTSEPTRQTRP